MSPETAHILTMALIVLMKIVCFIIGYLTIRLGYQLIASGVKGEFKFSTNLGGFKADLASVSPGLLFVLLGVLLIGYAMYVEKGGRVELKRAPPDVTIQDEREPTSYDTFRKEKKSDEH